MTPRGWLGPYRKPLQAWGIFLSAARRGRFLSLVLKRAGSLFLYQSEGAKIGSGGSVGSSSFFFFTTRHPVSCQLVAGWYASHTRSCSATEYICTPTWHSRCLCRASRRPGEPPPEHVACYEVDLPAGIWDFVAPGSVHSLAPFGRCFLTSYRRGYGDKRGRSCLLQSNPHCMLLVDIFCFLKFPCTIFISAASYLAP